MSLEAFYGLGIGYNFALARKKELELKQGKNDYQASLYQIQGLSSFTSLASNILTQIPYAPIRIGATIGNTILPFAGLILIPSSAAIKNGHYEQGVRCFDSLVEKKYPRLKGILPEKIEEASINAYTFLSDNANTMTSVGIAIGTIALPFLGFGSFVAGIGAPIVYHGLESANLIPSCINSLVEKYMPTVVNASMLLGGGPIGKVFALATLSSGLPGASDYVQKKIEKVFLSTTKGPSLKEIDGPWLEKNDLSFDEIQYILENDAEYLYEVNPAHCSKQVDLQATLPKDYDFIGFLTLFEKINWKERYGVLKSAFRDDDRFFDLLEEKFGKQDFRNDFEIYIEKWALEINSSKEDVLANQLQKQINDFVSILCKEKAVKGFAYDLEDAIESCSSILAYLKSSPEASAVEIEDILIKLAVEGGDYCARGIKRAAAEINCGLTELTYELKIRQQLQLIRQRIMQNTYQKMIEIMVRLAKEGGGVFVSKETQTTDVHAVAIAQDVHTIDLYRQYLALGFYPMTSNERSQFGVSDFATWSLYRPIRDQMYQAYQTMLDNPIKEHGEIHFVNYIRQKINDLPLLQEQQEALIDKLIDYDAGEKAIKSFHRLFFVMQGILKVKPIYTDWIELNSEPIFSDEQLEKELAEWEITI